jgi:2-methylcitrate dehydratase PrpD
MGASSTSIPTGGDPDAAVAGLGSDWTLKTISLRLWPAASSIQTVITGLFALIEAHDVRPDDIERVEVGLSKTVYDMHGTLPWDNKFRALLSTPYVTGVVLHDRKCWFEQFTPDRISNPDLDAFIKSRVSVAIDDAVEGTGAAVTIRTKDGRTLEDRRAIRRGDAADPLNRAEIGEVPPVGAGSGRPRRDRTGHCPTGATGRSRRHVDGSRASRTARQAAA